MATEQENHVPDSVIPHGSLPPLRYRDLPEPISLRRMIGPSIVLTGLALGSGEFIFWPYITYKTGFVFFWACILGVITQYFLNMEIERWTLATGESVITGFCRLSLHWAWIFLILNIVPWAWPGWATGAAQIISWSIWEPQMTETGLQSYHVIPMAIGSLLLVGVILTSGPVVYNTVERLQLILVSLVFVFAILLAIAVVRWEHIQAMLYGIMSIGQMPDESSSGLDTIFLLGALAFAGAGGTTNLCQSNFIKDKGYGMGHYVGRITSPVTGQEEAVSDVGYHFPYTEENISRWNAWWQAANREHALTFILPCLLSLALLSLISYALIHGSDTDYSQDINFVWGQATEIHVRLGVLFKWAFLGIGIAALLTTELGILDACARISSDIVKMNFCRQIDWLSGSKLYFIFLWAEIVFGCFILLIGMDKPGLLLKTTAAMNGGVMFLYSMTLLYLNKRALRGALSMHPVRLLALIWSTLFFGYFTIKALVIEVIPYLRDVAGLT